MEGDYMRYLSDDGRVFQTEKECSVYETARKRIVEQERIEREQREQRQKDLLMTIRKKYKELHGLIYEYGKTYGTEQEIYFTPLGDFVNMLTR